MILKYHIYFSLPPLQFCTVVEINSLGWEAKICISSCRFSQGRGWQIKVCTFPHSHFIFFNTGIYFLILILACLREYFEDVDQTWETFEKTLWGHIANFYKLAKERFVPFLFWIFLVVGFCHF